MSIILGSVLFVGCKKDDDNNPGTGGSTGPYKVKFVGTFSAGSKISTASITYGVNSKSFTALSGTSFTQEMTFTENDVRAFSNNPTKNISFGLQGEGKDASSTGKVEIFVNGSSVKTADATGTILTPQATYIFN
jgi:hypothetical protein